MPWRVARDWSRFFERGSTRSHFNLNTGANNGTGGFVNNLNLVFIKAVPEPGTWAAAALLAGGAAFMRWRKRNKVS